MSAPRCTRPFRALWCVAVLTTHLSCTSCCRRRRGIADDSRAPGAYTAQPERPRANTAALLVHSGWPTRTGGSATINFTSQGDFRNYPGARNVPIED